MSPPDIPSAVADASRLAALASYDILDTPAEPGFDDIVQLACRLCAAPVALVSLVAVERQWFKAGIGFPHSETDLGSSICAHALAEPDALLIIPDLTRDLRTAANPLVTGEPHLRFYAGAPLRTPKGYVLGSLCVIDTIPRPGGLNPEQAADLQAMARQVMIQLELRRTIARRDELRRTNAEAFRAREALNDTHAALASISGNRDAMLDEVVTGAMRAVPAAEGGVIELVTGGALEYQAVRGSLAMFQGLRLPLRGSLAGRCVLTKQSALMADAYEDPHVRRDLVETLRLRSAVIAPILRDDAVLGVLKLQSSRPSAFTERDLEQVRLFAGAVTVGLAEVEARQAVLTSETYWRGLFDRLSEGFQVSEVIRDAAKRITDWRYVEVNPAWSTLVGLDPEQIVGRTFRAVFPDAERFWIDELAAVVDTGEPITFLRQFGFRQRWFEGRAFKLDANRFGVMFLEVTARVEADARRAALLTLGDRLRDLTTVREMTFAAAEIVGRTLGATRAGFGRVEGDVDMLEIEPDWTAPGMVSIAGRHRFDDYGDLRTDLQRGEPLVIEDVLVDPRTRDDPAPMQAIGIRALVNIPVRERGRTVAVFIVHDSRARAWAAEELAFLRNVADRLEVGVARVRSEELQTTLNAELAHRLKNTLAIVQSIATQTLRGVTEKDLVEAFDRRVLALSRAHDVLLKKSWSVARLRTVMESVLSMQAEFDRFVLDGSDMDIGPQAALSLSLLLHELATNALKYGALSVGGGKVLVSWRTEDETMVLDWIEQGGPPVTPPRERGGFGSKLIRMGLLGTRNANLRYEPSGLRAEFRAPLAELQMRVH